MFPGYGETIGVTVVLLSTAVGFFGMLFGTAVNGIRIIIGDVVHGVTGTKESEQYGKKGERGVLLSIGFGIGVFICSTVVGCVIDAFGTGSGLFGL